ncbi:MAG: hypothetical protein HW413_2266 [Thermoleophilia bacterium]|nr:hypothetical protein [Thermoleophilia bacterium]
MPPSASRGRERGRGLARGVRWRGRTAHLLPGVLGAGVRGWLVGRVRGLHRDHHLKQRRELPTVRLHASRNERLPSVREHDDVTGLDIRRRVLDQAEVIAGRVGGGRSAIATNLAGRLTPGVTGERISSWPVEMMCLRSEEASLPKLERLAKLRERGLLTEPEFAAAKERALRENRVDAVQATGSPPASRLPVQRSRRFRRHPVLLRRCPRRNERGSRRHGGTTS